MTVAVLTGSDSVRDRVTRRKSAYLSFSCTVRARNPPARARDATASAMREP